MLALPLTILSTNPCDPGQTQDAKVQYVYLNNQKTTINEEGNQRRYTYNVLGQMTVVEEPSPTLDTPAVTIYKYYGFGGLYQTSQSGQVRTLTQDWLGRELSENLPESGTTTFTYNNAGNLLTATDARSVVTTYTYDDIGRPLSRSYSPGTPMVTFAYDQWFSAFKGLRTSMTDSLGTFTYIYDNYGRLIEEWREFDSQKAGISGTYYTNYDYNLKGDLIYMRYPSGREVNFSYATASGCCNSRLKSVTDSTTSTVIADDITYTAAGAASTLTLNPNGTAIAQQFTYNHRMQQTGITATISTVDVMDFAYGYGTTNNTGQLRTRTDAIQPEHSASYVYDSIYRLSQVIGSDESWGIAWTFDVWSNRLTQTPLGVVDRPGGIASQTIGYANNRNTSLTYDSAGNVTNDGSKNYTFNGKNQITHVSGNEVYWYDGEGRRAKRIDDQGVTTYYFYGPGGIISEFTTQSGATSAASNDRQTYRTSDRQDTAVLTTNADGLIIENSRTLPYGELWQVDIASTNPKKYTSYERDRETGLDYAMERYSASVEGRFMSPDPGPINPGVPTSLNRYLYAVGNPIKYIDPSGRIPPLLNCSYLEEINPAFECAWTETPFERRGEYMVIPQKTSIEKAQEKFQRDVDREFKKAKNKLDPNKIKPDCVTLFVQLGLTVDNVNELLDNAIFVNGSISTEPLVLFMDPSYLSANNMMSWTVQHLFVNGGPEGKPRGMTGNGWSFLKAGSVSWELLIHEALHNVPRLDDQTIMSAWSVTGPGTSGITKKIGDKCN